MAYEITHAVRGRLRVRYPVPWLRTRREVVVTRLRSLPGVRAVNGSRVTGSLLIDYDPFVLAELGIVEALHELDQRLGGTPGDRTAPRRQRVVQRRTPLLNVLATTSVLAAACLPAPPALVAGLVFASAATSWRRPPCSCWRPAGTTPRPRC